jgi:hypothetical protein
MLSAIDDGNVTFYPVEPDDLRSVVSFPQAFDNQWVPRQLLTRMMKSPNGMTAEAIENERLPLVRREYIRALVNTDQVVINRAFLYNNPTIYQDFIRPGQEREAVKELLSAGTIIPFFYRESSPATPPDFDVSRGWNEWLKLIQECTPNCLRLCWESAAANGRQTERLLSGEFAKFAETVGHFEAVLLASDCGLPARDVLPLQDRLKEVAAWSQARFQAGESLTRTDLYKQFVVVKGTNPGDRQYDPHKPFAAQLKQLIDLRYNANTPDALRSYLLTPDDSLRRTALQEWRAGGGAAFTDAAALTDLVRKLRFDRVTDVLGALAAFDFLAVSDIAKLRNTEAWQHYHRTLRTFLEQPTLELLADQDRGAEAVALAYSEVIREAGAIAGSRIEDARLRKWAPVIEIMVEFAGAVVSVFFNVGGGQGLAYRISHGVAPGLATRTAKVVVHLVIGRFTQARTQSKIDNGIRVLERRLDRGRRDWDEFIAALGSLGFRELGELPVQKGQIEKASEE